MTDMSKAWDYSIAKCLGKRERMFSTNREAVPRWLINVVLRLEEALPAYHPVEPLCVTSVDVDYEHMYDRHHIRCGVLAQRGWGLNMSLMLFKNFRFMYPTLKYDPQMHAVMSRQQLVDEYGDTFGNVFADLCRDPASQPILWHLLNNKLESQLHRPCIHAWTTFTVDQQNGKGQFARLPLYAYGAAADENTPISSMLIADAEARYRHATGLEPDFTYSLDPREVDYELKAQEESAKETVRGLVGRLLGRD